MNIHPRNIFLAVAMVCAMFFVAANAHAASITWTGGGTTSAWANGANWSGGSAPGAADTAIFSGSACSSNCSPVVTSTVSISGLQIYGGYGGTISQQSGNSITIGGGGFTMYGTDGATWSGTTSSASGTYYTSGKTGTYGGFFNGSNDYVQSQNIPDINSNAQAFSVSLWFKASTTGDILNETGQTALNTGWSDDWVEVQAAGALYVRVWNCTKLFAGTSTFNTWTQVGFTYDGATLKSFFNGAQVSSEACTRSSPAGSGYAEYLNLGANNVTNMGINAYFSGSIDEFRLYNAALATSTMNSIYTGSAPTSSLITYWNFEEGSGSVLQDSSPTGAGQFTGSNNASDTITINGGGSFNQYGGTFKSTAGNLIVQGNVNLAGGTFNSNGGTVSVGNGDTYASQVSCKNTPFNVVVLNKNPNNTGGVITINSGCTVPIGSNPTSNLSVWGGSTYGVTNPYSNYNSNVGLINYGTITGSGTWNIYENDYNNDVWNFGTITVGGINFQGVMTNLVNQGTINVSSTWNAGLENLTSGAVVNFGTATISVPANFMVATGTITYPSALNLTFTATAMQSYISCNSSQFNQVTLTKYLYATGGPVIILAGCTVPLGSGQTSNLGVVGGSALGLTNPYSNYGSNFGLVNYGTITGTGTWTVNTGDYQTDIWNYGTISVTGISFTNYSSDLVNYGTVNVSSTWNAGLVNNTGGIVNLSTSTVSSPADFLIASGTVNYPSALNLTFTSTAWRSYVSCNSSQFSQVTLNKYLTATGGPVVILAGCTIPLGSSQTSNLGVVGGSMFGLTNPYSRYGSNLGLLNYGTITGTGTWTVNTGDYQTDIWNYGTISVTGISFTNYSSDLVNYGTVNVSSTWNAGLVNNTGGIVNLSTSTVSSPADFVISSGTINYPSALNITFTASDWRSYVGCNSTQFSQVTFTKGLFATGGTIIVLAGCTVPLSSQTTNLSDEAASTYGLSNSYSGDGGVPLINYGTITSTSTWTLYEWDYQTDIYNFGTMNLAGINFTGLTTDLVNSGTINVSSTWNAGLVNTTGGVINFGTSTVSSPADFVIASGTVTYPSALNLTFTYTNLRSNVGCNSSQFNQVVFNKNPNSGTGGGTIVLAGCTVPLGSNQTSNFNIESRNDFGLTNPYTGNSFILLNYGTINASGGWIINETNYNGDIYNYGTINIPGSLNLIGIVTDLVNYGTLSVGGPWTGGGLVNQASSTFALTGGQMTAYYDVVVVTSTVSTPVNLTMNGGNTNPVYFGPSNATWSGITLSKPNNWTVNYLTNGTSTFDTGNFSFTAGNISFGASTYSVIVQGNYLQSSGNTFGASNITLAMTGNTSSTISDLAGTFSANLDVNKTGIPSAQLVSDLTVGGTCTVDGGTFDVNSRNFTCTGATTVNTYGWLVDYASYASTIKLGANMTNNGMVFLDGSGSACVTPYPQYVTLQSSASGTQRTWSGSGTEIIRYTKVQDQTGGGVTVWNGTNLGNSGWTFQNSYGRPQLVQNSPMPSYANGGSLNLPFVYPPRPGDLIVVAVAEDGQTITPPTDNASNTFVLATTTSFTGPGPAPSNTLAIYYAQNVQSLPPTWTYYVQAHGSGGGSSYIGGEAFEFVGLSTSSTFDKVASNVDTSGNAITLTSGSATGQSTKDELFFGLAVPAMLGSTTSAVSAGSGWLSLPGQQSIIGIPGLIPEYQSSSTPNTGAASWTSAASTTYGAIMAIFDPPGANSTGYSASGTLDSPIFDTQSSGGAVLNSVTWSGTASQGAGVGFQFAVSNATSGPWTFMGPSGDGTTYFPGGLGGPSTNPGTPILLVSNSGGSGYGLFSGYRYFRYRVILFAGNNNLSTPTVTGVNVNWSP